MDHVSDTPAFDAFGDTVPASRTLFDTAAQRSARIVAIALFWSLALLLVAGRVYYAPAHMSVAAIEIAAR